MAAPQFTHGSDEDYTGFWCGDPNQDGLNRWNTILVDGEVFPGASGLADPRACAVKVRAKNAYRVDHAKIKGRDGHRLVIEGYQPETIEIDVYIWTPAQYRAYEAYVSKINPKLRPGGPAKQQPQSQAQINRSLAGLASGAAAATVPGMSTTLAAAAGATSAASSTANAHLAHSVEHPDLALLAISSVYFTEVPTPEDGPVFGLRIVRLKAIEVYDDGSKKKAVTKALKPTDAQVKVHKDVQNVAPKLDTGPDPGKV